MFCIELVTALGHDLGLDNRDTDTICYRYSSEGFSFLSKVLPSFYKKVLYAFENAYESGFYNPEAFRFDVPSFANSGISGRPYFLKRFTDLIATGDPSKVSKGFSTIAQVCLTFYKTVTEFTSEQQSEAEKNFISDDESCAVFNEMDRTEAFKQAGPVIRGLYDQRKISVWLSRPKDGPGVCAEQSEKCREIFRLSSSIFTHFLSFNPSHEEEIQDRLHPLNTRDYFRPGLSMPSRGIFVPKDSRGPRFIAAEPSQNMRLQQSVRNFLEADLHDYSYGRINFEDQSVNGRLALSSSITRSFQTLDLKSASDRVPYAALELFDPTLAFVLRSTRSQCMELPSGRVLRLSKFAPMGSALCFPVLSAYTYAAAVVYITTVHGYSTDEAKRSVFVFGDDLIIPSFVDKEHFANFILLNFNLKLNVDKSFRNSHFRESCGVNAVYGIDITPVRLNELPKDFPSWIRAVKFANNLSQKGRMKAAYYIWSRFEKKFGDLPFGADGAPYLHKFVPGFDHRVLNESRYRRRFKGITQVPLTEKLKESLFDYFFRTWKVPVHIRPLLGEKTSRKTKVKRKWFPIWNGFPANRWLP